MRMEYAVAAAAFLGLAAVANAQSAPVKGAACAAGKNVRPVPGGMGVYFDENCQTAYVLPPAKGRAQIYQIAGSSSLAQCEEISNLSASILGLTARMRRITEEMAPKPAAPGSWPSGPFPGGRPPIAPAPAGSPMTQEQRTEMDGLIEEMHKLSEERKSAGSTFGASASFFYELPTQQLVEAYAKANPGIRFEPLQLSRAYLSFNRKEASSADPVGTAVIGMFVPSLGLQLPDAPDPRNLQPRGERVADQQVDPPNPALGRIFGASLSGTMQLSLFGACPYVDPATGRMPSKLTDQQLTAHLAANVQYAYALQAIRSYKASYNLAVLVRKMASASTSGGFLSTRTINSYVDDEKTNDWFRFESQSNDPRFYYPYIVQEIKAGLIDRVVRQIAYAKVGGPEPLAGLAAPAANGASKASEGLRRCPYFYCQAGAVILDVVNASFGSTSAVNSFLKQNDSWARDDVTEKTMLEFFGSAGFVGDQT